MIRVGRVPELDLVGLFKRTIRPVDDDCEIDAVRLGDSTDGEDTKPLFDNVDTVDVAIWRDEFCNTDALLVITVNGDDDIDMGSATGMGCTRRDELPVGKGLIMERV